MALLPLSFTPRLRWGPLAPTSCLPVRRLDAVMWPAEEPDDSCARVRIDGLRLAGATDCGARQLGTGGLRAVIAGALSRLAKAGAKNRGICRLSSSTILRFLNRQGPAFGGRPRPYALASPGWIETKGTPSTIRGCSCASCAGRTRDAHALHRADPRPAPDLIRRVGRGSPAITKRADHAHRFRIVRAAALALP